MHHLQSQIPSDGDTALSDGCNCCVMSGLALSDCIEIPSFDPEVSHMLSIEVNFEN